MNFGHTYLQLRGNSELAAEFRKNLGIDMLPIVSPFPEVIDCEEYGVLTSLSIDASRLSADQRERLVNWVLRDGDNPYRDEVIADVDANNVCYTLYGDDQSEVIQHNPAAWG